MASIRTRSLKVALLTLGSAILLFSCEGRDAAAEAANDAARMTEYSENLSIVMSQNGMRSYFFETPLLEGYSLAAEPYREFRRGIRMTTYQDDSLASVDAVLTSNYAIYYEQQQLWELRGNVEVHKFDGTELYTQQLFWNARTKRVYSNVDTKFVKGNNVSIGERFESDDAFKDWRFRYQQTRMEVETAPSERDTTAAASTAPVAPAATESVRAERRNAAPPRPAARRTADPDAVRMQGTQPARRRAERLSEEAVLRAQPLSDTEAERRPDAVVDRLPAAPLRRDAAPAR